MEALALNGLADGWSAVCSDGVGAAAWFGAAEAPLVSSAVDLSGSCSSV